MSNLINNQEIAKLSNVQEYAIWNYTNNNLNLNNHKSNHITTDCTWLYFIKKILPNDCQIQARINDIK
ncbi:MAG: hypothetical protein R3Y29_01870 [bacterium]